MKQFKLRITRLYWCRDCDFFFHGDECVRCGKRPTQKNTEEIK